VKHLWVEDFLALVDAGTFSRAAALRNVSQPAFSRRIQQLEAWLKVELVDRHAQPMRLTPIAERHIPLFRGLMRDISRLRDSLQSGDSGTARIVLATQHSLTISRLPALLQILARSQHPRIEVHVRSENRDDCVALFMSGEADLLFCMEQENDLLHSLVPATHRLPMGYDRLVPISACSGRKGRPLHTPKAGSSLKLLAFPPDSFMGRVLYKNSLDALFQQHRVEVVHESLFLAGVKEMVLAGLGIAWLPESLVERELEAGTLVALNDVLQVITLGLALYRNEQTHNPAAMAQIWAMLGDRPPQARSGPADIGRTISARLRPASPRAKQARPARRA